MAAPQPVPSRALLHALRGILLTASCSVALLAEERRRRIKFAHQALENARKIHSAKTARNAAIRADSNGIFSEHGAVFDEDTLAALQRADLERLKRHRHLNSRKAERPLDDFTYEAPRPTMARDREPSDVYRHLLPRAKAYVDDLLAELAQTTPPPTSYPRKNIDALKISGGEPKIPVLTGSRRQMSFSETGTLNLEPASLDTRQAETEAAGESSNVALSGNGCPEIMAAVEHLGKEEARYRPRIHNGLLQVLMSTDTRTPATLQAVGLYIALLGKVSAADANAPMASAQDAIVRQGLRLLKRCAKIHPESVVPILAALLPLVEEKVDMVSLFLRWLFENGLSTETRTLLQSLHQPEFRSVWQGGRFILQSFEKFRKLQDHPKRQFVAVRQFYLHLCDAGLFQSVSLKKKDTWALHRALLHWAVAAEDVAFAEAQMEALSKLDPTAAKQDIYIQCVRVTLPAILGQWRQVHFLLGKLCASDEAQRKQIHELIERLAQMCARGRSGDELESLIMGSVTRHGLPISHKWALEVATKHANRGDLNRVISWLEFCRDRGLEMTLEFIKSIQTVCSDRWGLSQQDIITLLEKPSGRGEGIECLQNERQTGIRGSAAHKPTVRVAPAKSSADSATYERMHSLAKKTRWRDVCTVYEGMAASQAPVSESCLALAIEAYVACGNHTLAADALAGWERRGHRLQEASTLTPLLLARIQSGENAFTVVRRTLYEGHRIEDVVYDKAAQALVAQGDVTDSAVMCKFAARQNGDDNLLYNSSNFKNLVFAYTAGAQYRRLDSVLSQFMSQPAPWHRDLICKDTIEFAMKAVAKRAVAADGQAPAKYLYHFEALQKLEQALDYHLEFLGEKLRRLNAEKSSVWERIGLLSGNRDTPTAQVAASVG
ncbi:hypothetical protein B0I35DRAFT_430156 [Stachybotrys elegans]|uniref:Uncharacterized protein n=1 Tax=Stachybotrys elegans TaxID=80388 RepID=A0A8K0ST21_9HYPO|nr:hypothetical protein B0I35DRAFT_430156 [Stachybotrys elegans]